MRANEFLKWASLSCFTGGCEKPIVTHFLDELGYPYQDENTNEVASFFR